MSTRTGRTGVAQLPLHGGRAPRWLFERMVRLARGIAIYIVTESGPDEFIRRLSHPFWFQSLSCVLGFDWHSSGTTTTTCGALKEALKGLEAEYGLFVCGGKGGTSRRTPQEITAKAPLEPETLIYASKMAAKVDNTALQDGYQLYHHSFFFTSAGTWAVVQQGMNPANRMARRYHWLSEEVDSFVVEPQKAICCDARGEALNLVAQESDRARAAIAQVAVRKPEQNLKDLAKLLQLSLPVRHDILAGDLKPDALRKILTTTYAGQPHDFEAVLGLKGVGPKTMRAFSLLAEVLCGAPPSYRDPVRYAFAHGGKDGIPYPVDRRTYDQSIHILEQAVRRTKAPPSEREEALRRLARYAAGLK